MCISNESTLMKIYIFLVLGTFVCLSKASFLSNLVRFDPDFYLETPELIARHGYPSESHTIETIDGYLLTMHRIPHGKNGKNTLEPRQPVFLQHGILDSSADFTLNGPGNALAYILSDLGYDVWMGNARGNIYSQSHVTLTSSDAEFWDFSWDEMAKYDLPAELDYVANITGNSGNMLYIGHSMGNTMFFALMATQPEYNDKVKAMFALAPVAYMQHLKSPVRFIAPWANLIKRLFNLLGVHEFLPNNKCLRFLLELGCSLPVTETICENLLFVIIGFDKSQLSKTMLPIYLAHTPAGTSINTIVQYAQEIVSYGRFQYYDLGTNGNKKKYGTDDPPQYNVSQITVPIALYYSDNDLIADSMDVQHLYKDLPNPIGLFRVNYTQFNHLDFLWAINASKIVYEPLIKLMHKYK